MAVGLKVDRATLDSIIGGNARQILEAIYTATKVRRQLAAMPNEMFQALGYTDADIALIRQLVEDMADAGDVFAGMSADPITISNGDGTKREATLRNFGQTLAAVAGFRG